jgi:hypothetical protein
MRRENPWSDEREEAEDASMGLGSESVSDPESASMDGIEMACRGDNSDLMEH